MNKNKNVLDLIMLLSRVSLTLDSIAARFDVSYRTAHRYIDSIRKSDVPLIEYKPDAWRPVCYEVSLMEKPKDKNRKLDEMWHRLIVQYGSIGGVKKKSVLVLCESCNIEKKITPIPDDRPECPKCNRPVLIDRFV